jgi:hypothetical protein
MINHFSDEELGYLLEGKRVIDSSDSFLDGPVESFNFGHMFVTSGDVEVYV